MTILYSFKVYDYTTILYGQYEKPQKGEEGYFYVERGDGYRQKYSDSRIEFSKEIWRSE